MNKWNFNRGCYVNNIISRCDTSTCRKIGRRRYILWDRPVDRRSWEQLVEIGQADCAKASRQIERARNRCHWIFHNFDLWIWKWFGAKCVPHRDFLVICDLVSTLNKFKPAKIMIDLFESFTRRIEEKTHKKRMHQIYHLYNDKWFDVNCEKCPSFEYLRDHGDFSNAHLIRIGYFYSKGCCIPIHCVAFCRRKENKSYQTRKKRAHADWETKKGRKAESFSAQFKYDSGFLCVGNLVYPFRKSSFVAERGEYPTVYKSLHALCRPIFFLDLGNNGNTIIWEQTNIAQPKLGNQANRYNRVLLISC